jgi:hypothetical protein
MQAEEDLENLKHTIRFIFAKRNPGSIAKVERSGAHSSFNKFFDLMIMF